MSQRQQLERILEIDRRIRAGQFPNPDSLAADMEVCRRVIFNDRNFLIDRLGAPLIFDRERGGWAYSDPTWSLPSVFVTEGELLAVFIGVEVARRYAGSALERPLMAAVEKIARGLKGPVSVDLGELSERITVAEPSALGVEENVLMELQRALRERRTLVLRYFTASRRQESERTVQPHLLHNRGGEWYLVAWDLSRRGFRVFHAGRIRSIRDARKRFQPRPDAEAARYLEESFQVLAGHAPVHVAVRFDAEQAPYIRERRWHPSQTLEDLPGGAVLLAFTTTGLLGVRRWVLQYGRHAQVLEPRELREAVAREARALCSMYGPKRAPSRR